jgi:hypothetical protein
MLPHCDPQPTLFFYNLPPSPLGSPAPGAGSGVMVVSSYQKLVVVSFKIEVDLLRELDVLAEERGTTRSEIIRRALRWYIKSLRPTVTPRMTIYHGYSSNDNNTSRIRFR